MPRGCYAVDRASIYHGYGGNLPLAGGTNSNVDRGIDIPWEGVEITCVAGQNILSRDLMCHG